MFANDCYLQAQNVEVRRKLHPDCDPYAAMEAANLYEGATRKAWWRNLWRRLGGKTAQRLLDLNEVKAATVSNRHDLGMREVAIEKIHGSLGRTCDFDGDFSPMNERVKARWISVATAWMQGMGLPAVELVKVGEVYFVIDGNHRVSVARAMDKMAIDAHVVEWETNAKMLWEDAEVQLRRRLLTVFVSY